MSLDTFDVFYTHDSADDMHYFRLTGETTYRQVKTEAIIDLDKEGNITGIEVFGVKQVPND